MATVSPSPKRATLARSISADQRSSDTKKSERKSRWLEMRIAVLKARLDYPTDEVLQQLEEAVEARKRLGRKKFRQFLDQLNTRLVELQNFG